MLDFRKMTAVLAACAVSCATLFAAGTAAPVCAVIDAEDPYSYDVYYADSGLRMAVYHGAGYEDATSTLTVRCPLRMLSQSTSST